MLPALMISPLFSSEIPQEVKIKYFSCLTLPQLCKSGEVCKEWFKLSRDKVIWIPSFKQLNPFANRQFAVDGQENIKSEILCDLQKNQKRVDQVISLIENDEQLTSFIDNSSLSLADLKKMLPIERAMHVMRLLRKDCTQLLVCIPKKYTNDAEKQIKEKYAETGHNAWLLHSIVSNFNKDNKSLLFLLELVKDPFGPFNAEEAMSATLPLYKSYLASNTALNICAEIVKSHPDLSTFFKTSINTGDFYSGDNFIPMTQMVSDILIPKMEELGLGVTMDDWIQCGFNPSAA